MTLLENDSAVCKSYKHAVCHYHSSLVAMEILYPSHNIKGFYGNRVTTYRAFSSFAPIAKAYFTPSCAFPDWQYLLTNQGRCDLA